MTVTVSVILPVYNRQRTLLNAINSVLAQSYADFELLVVDDASTQDIAAIVGSVKDPRVKYLRRAKNGGAAAARNTGLAEARGQFIAFQDSDDLWLPDKLAGQVERLSAAGSEIGAVTGSKIVYGIDSGYKYGSGRASVEPNPDHPLPADGDQLRHLLGQNRVSVQCALFRRDCYPEKTWFDPRARANEDWEFAVRLAQQTRILEFPEPVLLGFTSNDSISRGWRKQAIGTVRLLKKNKALATKYPREFAWIAFELGMTLFKTGKRRLGTRFMIAALTHHHSVLWRFLARKLGYYKP